MEKKYILLQPLRCCLFIVSFCMLSFFTRNSLTDLSKWWSIIASVINIITIYFLLFFCKQKKYTYYNLINYKRGNINIKPIIVMTLLVLLVGMGGMYIAGYLCYGKFPYMATMMIQPLPIVLALLNVFVLPLTTTLAEDGLYLGMGVNHIENKWLAIFIPAFFYAFQHSFIPMLFDVRYIAYRFLSFLPLTILMCYMYYRKRNPIPFMVGHFVINIVTVAQIVMTSVSPELYEMMSNI